MKKHVTSGILLNKRKAILQDVGSEKQDLITEDPTLSISERVDQKENINPGQN